MPNMTKQVTPPGGGEGDGCEAVVGVGDGVPDGGVAVLLGFADAGGEAGGVPDSGAGVAVTGPGRVPADPPAAPVAPGAGRALRRERGPAL